MITSTALYRAAWQLYDCNLWTPARMLFDAADALAVVEATKEDSGGDVHEIPSCSVVNHSAGSGPETGAISTLPPGAP